MIQKRGAKRSGGGQSARQVIIIFEATVRCSQSQRRKFAATTVATCSKYRALKGEIKGRLSLSEGGRAFLRLASRPIIFIYAATTRRASKCGAVSFSRFLFPFLFFFQSSWSPMGSTGQWRCVRADNRGWAQVNGLRGSAPVQHTATAYLVYYNSCVGYASGVHAGCSCDGGPTSRRDFQERRPSLREGGDFAVNACRGTKFWG